MAAEKVPLRHSYRFAFAQLIICQYIRKYSQIKSAITENLEDIILFNFAQCHLHLLPAGHQESRRDCSQLFILFA